MIDPFVICVGFCFRPSLREVHKRGTLDWRICVGGSGIWLVKRSRFLFFFLFLFFSLTSLFADLVANLSQIVVIELSFIFPFLIVSTFKSGFLGEL